MADATQRLRLLLATDSYPPFVGGADRQVQHLAYAMQAAGHEVTVVTPWQPGLSVREMDGGVLIVRIRPFMTRVPWFSRDAARRHHPPFPDPGSVVAIRRLIRERDPQLIHSYGWISYSVGLAARGRRSRLAVSARDYAYVCAVRSYLHASGTVCTGPGLRKCTSCAIRTYTLDEAGNAVLGRDDLPVTFRHRIRGAGKAVVAVASVRLGRPIVRGRIRGLHSVSAFVREVMDRELLGDKRASVVHHVIPSFLVDGQPGEPDAGALAALPTQPFILFVGALTPAKGVWQLLAAYRRLRPGAPPLVLLGPSFHNSPTDLPAGAHHLGSVSHATVLAAWDRALFGVVPSVGAETFGNVVTEALSRGRPVVASRLGGIVDIVVDGESGILVPPADVDALAAAMQRLIDDPTERLRLGAGARLRATRFEESQVMPSFKAFYGSVMERG